MSDSNQVSRTPPNGEKGHKIMLPLYSWSHVLNSRIPIIPPAVVAHYWGRFISWSRRHLADECWKESLQWNEVMECFRCTQATRFQYLNMHEICSAPYISPGVVAPVTVVQGLGGCCLWVSYHPSFLLSLLSAVCVTPMFIPWSRVNNSHLATSWWIV